MLKEKIGVIGAGKIGSAIARGVIRRRLGGKDKSWPATSATRCARRSLGDWASKSTPDNGALCEFADIIILAVKPQIVDPVAKEIAKKLGKTKLVVSVAAGVPLARIEAQSGAGRARRARDAEYSLRRRRRRRRFCRRRSCHGRGFGKSRRDSQQLRHRSCR